MLCTWARCFGLPLGRFLLISYRFLLVAFFKYEGFNEDEYLVLLQHHIRFEPNWSLHTLLDFI